MPPPLNTLQASLSSSSLSSISSNSTSAPTPAYIQPPNSQKRIARSDQPPTKEDFDKLNELIYRIPSTTTFLTSSVENMANGEIWWIMKCWSLYKVDDPRELMYNDSEKKSGLEEDTSVQIQTGDAYLEDKPGQFNQINDQIDNDLELQNDLQHIYDDYTTDLYNQVLVEVLKMAEEGEKLDEVHSSEFCIMDEEVNKKEMKVEIKRFKKILYGPHNNTNIPSIDSLVHAFNFGWVNIDFDQSNLKIIVETSQGEVILTEESEQENANQGKQEKDELSFWFAKFLENNNEHGGISVPFIPPLKEPKYNLNSSTRVFNNEINAFRRKNKEFKRKYREMINREVTRAEPSEFELKQQQRAQEKWEKINAWMESYRIHKREREGNKRDKENKEINLGRLSVIEQITFDQEQGRKTHQNGITSSNTRAWTNTTTEPNRQIKQPLWLKQDIKYPSTRSRQKIDITTTNEDEESTQEIDNLSSSKTNSTRKQGVKSSLKRLDSEDVISKKQKVVHFDAETDERYLI